MGRKKTKKNLLRFVAVRDFSESVDMFID